MRKLLFLSIIASFCSLFSYSQDFSNKGKDFWIPYPEHIDGTASAMGIYITSDVNSSGTIQVGAVAIPFTLTANSVVYKFLGPGAAGSAPNTAVYLGGYQDNVLSGKAIHITATQSVVVFAHIIKSARSGATLALPTTVWGKDYIVPGYASSGGSGAGQGIGVIDIISSKINTVVEITPSATVRNNLHPIGVPFTVTLPSIGDIYQLEFAQNADMSGTKIKSIASGTGGCNPIAVFSATTWSAINCNSGNGGDNFFQQLFPASSWGKQFLTGPLKKVATNALDNNVDIIRIFVSDPTTVVTKTVNGITTVLTGLTGSNFYEYTSSLPTFIHSDKPIEVVQYITTQTCGSPVTPSDPEMIALSSVEQTINDITVIAATTSGGPTNNGIVPPGQSNVNTHYINVIMKTNNTALFKINGASPSSLFTPIPGTNYSFLKENISARVNTNGVNPTSRLTADSGFLAIAYGFGNVESYGYNAGTYIKDLYTSYGTQSQYGIESGAVCTGSPFKFKISLPFKPDSIYWNMSGITNTPQYGIEKLLPVLPAVTLIPDSTTIVNLKPIYWYSLPGFYNFNTVGIYTIPITLFSANSDGCGTIQDRSFDLDVSAPPVADFTFTQPGCPADPVQFTDATISAKPNYIWNWNFGDPGSGAANTSALENPVHLFSTSGSHNVTMSTITTAGCFGTLSFKIVNVPAPVNAAINGTTSVCQNSTPPTIVFTITDGLPPYKISYTLSTNGGPAVGQTPIITNNTTNIISAPVNVVGTFTYSITNVENANAAFCNRSITGQSATITVNPLPAASISGTTTVCQNTASPDITFTGSNATAPYTFSYTMNGGPVQTVTTTSGNSVSVPVSTAVIGSYSYSLVSVTDGSATLCSQPASGTATVLVQATSTATISGSATVCQSAAAPIITFTAANGTAPFTFTYNINGGASQTISTTASSNSVTLTVPMVSAGTFVYNLTGVSNTGTIVCFTPITGASATVIINSVPTATIAGITTICQNSAAPDITFTGANAAAPYTFTYTINGGSPLTVTTTAGNSVTVSVPTSAFGTFTYALTQVKESSSTQCIRSYANTTATVTVKQLPTASIAGTTSVCQAGTSPNITFTAAGGVPPYTFSYTLNGSPLAVTTTVGNTVTVPVSTTAPGTFIYNLISVQESSSVTCLQNQSGTATVIVHPKPTASFTTVGPYCSQLAVTFTPVFGITPTGSIVSWVWDFGDGTSPQIRPDGNPFTVTYPTAGIKTVTFKTISDNGCVSNLFSIQVTINSKPRAGFINPAACLADANAQFTDTTGGTIVYWEWDFGDGSPVYAGSGPSYKDPLHAYSAVGQKTVKLIVTTNSGCKDTVIQQFFINGEVTRAAFITQNAANLCSNRPVQIKENSIVNVGGLIRTDIYWDYVGSPTVFDQDNTPTPGKIYTHNYPNLQTDQTYTIHYFAYSGFNGVCQKDTFINIIVRASPAAQFTSVPDACLNGGPVVLSQGSASGGTGVYMGPGVTFAGGVYTFDPLATGVVLGTNNSVVYTVTSSAGCDSAKVQQIKVLAPPAVNTFATVGNTCNNNNITFHQTYTNGDGTVVKWIYNWNDASPIQTMATGADVTHMYTTPGTHTATLTLETAYGCKNVPFPVTFTVNPLPAPSYTFSNSVCLPSANIVFTNTTFNVGSNTYLWSFELPSTSGANTSTQTDPSHIYTTQGPHSTNLVATNIATGCKDTSAIQIINSNTIHAEPVVQFTPVPDVCLNNGTVQLTQGSETSGMPGGPGIYTGPGVSASGVFDPITAGVGLHTLTYTWTSSFNCPASRTQTVRVLAPPVVNTFTTSGNKCETKSIIFQNTVSQGAGVINTWVYDWGDNTPITTAPNGNDITHTYALPGTYLATLYVVTNGSCKSAPAFQLQVIVNPLPVPNFTYSDTTCLPQAKVIFKNITPNINDWAYNWNFDFPSAIPGDQSTQQQNVIHTYTTLAPHDVKLTATSGLTGCTAFIIKPVTTIHPAPTASFTFDKSGVCLAQSVIVLDNSSFADGTSSAWLWNFGENASNSSGQIQSSYTYSAAGTYQVKLSVTNSFGCTDDTVRAFIVYPYPVVNAGPDLFVLEGGSVTLQATATGNNLSYLWTSVPAPTYLNSNTVLNPVAQPKTDITYTLTVTAQGGCSKPDNVFVKVLKNPDIPNTFTPNNDGIHDFWDIKYLNTYPQNKVQVFTRTGALVFESKGYTTPWDGNMNGKSLPFDTYYYIIEPGNGRKAITGYVTIIK